jgi:hypothetical protein
MLDFLKGAAVDCGGLSRLARGAGEFADLVRDIGTTLQTAPFAFSTRKVIDEYADRQRPITLDLFRRRA